MLNFTEFSRMNRTALITPWLLPAPDLPFPVVPPRHPLAMSWMKSADAELRDRLLTETIVEDGRLREYRTDRLKDMEMQNDRLHEYHYRDQVTLTTTDPARQYHPGKGIPSDPIRAYRRHDRVRKSEPLLKMNLTHVKLFSPPQSKIIACVKKSRPDIPQVSEEPRRFSSFLIKDILSGCASSDGESKKPNDGRGKKLQVSACWNIFLF